MRAGSVVYHGAFGFGKVIETAGAAETNGGKPVTVEFADGSIKQIQESYLIALPPDFHDALMREDYQREIPSKSYSRGIAYFRSGAVKEIGMSRNPLAVYGRVKGNTLYMVRVAWTEGRFRSMCSCPVGENCKHAAALLMEVRSELLRLRNDEAEKQKIMDLWAGLPSAEEFPEVSKPKLPENRSNFGWWTEKNDRLPVSAERYRTLSTEQKLDRLEQGLMKADCTDLVIEDLDSLCGEDDQAKARLLMTLLEDVGLERGGKLQGKKIIKAMEKLPHGKLLAALGKWLQDNEGHYRFRSALNEYLPGGRLEESLREDLFAYFEPFAEVREGNTEPEVVYTLRSSVGREPRTILRMTEGSWGSYVDQGLFAAGSLEAVAKLLQEEVKRREGDSLAKKIEDCRRQMAERERREREHRLQMDLSYLTERLAEPEERLRPEALVKAEYCLSKRNAYEFSLDMKVGIDRSYVVKDIRGFLRAMADEKKVSFGKNLSFVPLPENFVPEDRPVLELLQAFAESDVAYTEKRYLSLQDSQMDQLLRALKGRKIYYESKPYEISETKIEGNFNLDADGRLNLRDMPELDTVIETGRNLYAVSSAQQRIWPVAGSRREQQLLPFVLRNQDQPLGKHLETFRDQVYARFPERFTVDEALREKMQLSSLELRAYFDYRDRQILLNTRCLQGGRPCSPEALVSPVHRSLWERFREETEALGFGPEEDGGTRYLREDGAVLAFLRADLSALKTLCRVYLSESLKNKTLTAFAPKPLRIEGQGTMFRVFLEESAYSDAELEQVLKALRQKKKYLLLSGDRIVTLESQEALDFAETVKTLGLKDGGLREGQEVSFARTLRAIARGKFCRPDEYLSRLVEDIRGFKTADKPLPPLEVELRPYQREGFNWMRILAEYQLGGILADEMGLGKTLETIALLAADEEPGPSLVVCPKSLIFNWCSELARFAPQLKVREIYGSHPDRRERIRAIDPREKCLYVTSYDALRLDLADYGTEFSYLILDEAQYIKNVTAQKSRSVKQLAARHRFALTGTPIENSLLDLWSIFDFLLPGYFDSLESFRSSCKNDETYAERVRTLAAPFILRRTKAEVLSDLPEKFERVMTAEMTEAQQKIYDALKMQARDQLAAGGTAFSVLPSLMRLRQAAVDPGLFLEAYDGGSGKLELLRELVRDYVAQGHRLLIFSQFVQALDRVEALLQEEGLACFRITGDTPARERVRQMEDFNREDRVPVFLISLKAGGTGLNLVGADTVLQLDPWWNVAAENQASDRAHRIGQTRQVEVIRLISAGSVEQRVLELQRQKKDLIGRVISDSDASVTGITLEDIAALLQ